MYELFVWSSEGDDLGNETEVVEVLVALGNQELAQDVQQHWLEGQI